MTGPGTETEVLAALDSVVLDAWADVEQGADRDQVAVAYAMGLSVAAATLGRPSEVWASPDRDESVAARLAARTLRVWRAGDLEPDAGPVADPEGFVLDAMRDALEEFEGEEIDAQELIDTLEARNVVLAPVVVMTMGERSMDVATQVIALAEERIVKLRARVAEMEGRLLRINQSHVKSVDAGDGTTNGRCAECSWRWPCPTFAWSSAAATLDHVTSTWDANTDEWGTP